MTWTRGGQHEDRKDDDDDDDDGQTEEGGCGGAGSWQHAHTHTHTDGMRLQSKTGTAGSYLEVRLGQWQQENGLGHGWVAGLEDGRQEGRSLSLRGHQRDRTGQITRRSGDTMTQHCLEVFGGRGLRCMV